MYKCMDALLATWRSRCMKKTAFMIVQAWQMFPLTPLWVAGSKRITLKSSDIYLEPNYLKLYCQQVKQCFEEWYWPESWMCQQMNGLQCRMHRRVMREMVHMHCGRFTDTRAPRRPIYLRMHWQSRWLASIILHRFHTLGARGIGSCCRLMYV